MPSGLLEMRSAPQGILIERNCPSDLDALGNRPWLILSLRLCAGIWHAPLHAPLLTASAVSFCVTGNRPVYTH